MTTKQLADQLDFHWTHQLRPRLDGLTDDEYFWQPAPDPAPFTTIVWRLAHVIVGVLAVRNHAHFGRPPSASSTTSIQTWIDGVLYAHTNNTKES
jgi:hypothetical protein